jgi:hypothetical protein
MRFSALLVAVFTAQAYAASIVPKAATPGPWSKDILNLCTSSSNCKVVNGEPQIAKPGGAKATAPGQKIDTRIAVNQGTTSATCEPGAMVANALVRPLVSKSST